MKQYSFTRRQALLLGISTLTAASSIRLKQINSSSRTYTSASAPIQTFEILGHSSLQERAKIKGLLYGAASGRDLLVSDSEFAESFKQECGILVAENDLKWGTLRPTPHLFDFMKGDWLAGFAKDNNMLFRGHTLVWHWLPEWFEEVANANDAEQLLATHIRTVAGHYAGQMHSWDVVNEAIDIADGHPDGLRRRSPWFELMGADYIDVAFQVASEADPSSMLVYNDYGLEYDSYEDDSKRAAVLKLLERLKANGTPIHALGIQSHLIGGATNFNANKFREFLASVASMGLKIMGCIPPLRVSF